MRRTTKARRFAPLVAGAVLLAACGDDSADGEDTEVETGETDEEAATETEAAWPGDGSTTETFDLGEGLVADLPTDWQVEPFELPDPDTVPGGECAGPVASLDTGGGWLSLELNPRDCDRDDDPNERQIGNGNHGLYVTMDDVPEPGDVADHEVTAGSLVTFVQDYFECTNECTDYEDNIGLLELAAPPDPERPTVVLLDAKGEFSTDALVAVADAIRVDGPGADDGSDPDTGETTGAGPADVADVLVEAGVSGEDASCVAGELEALSPDELNDLAGASDLDELPGDLADEVRGYLDDCVGSDG